MKKCLFVVLLFTLNILYAQSIRKIPYLFDAGSRSSQIINYAELISLESLYNKTLGYGWTVSPDSVFYNAQLAHSTLRNDLTADGVIGEEISFRIDIPKGKWNFTFWMEQGLEDVNSASLFINGAKININWHQFHSDGDRINIIRNYYRVFQTQVDCNNGFEFKIAGGKDLVRLLGFSIIPLDTELKNNYSQLNKIIYQTGKYKSKVNPADLATAINEKLKQDPEDSYLFYWKQQADLLAEADRLINMMGWEWAKQLTGLSIFDRFHQALNILDSQLEHFDNSGYLFQERALWLRGKLCYDLYRERGGKYTYSIAVKDLFDLYKKYPGDIPLKMLNGAKIDFPDACDNLSFSPEAPQWSKLQHELICRLGNEIDWWVNERQAPNGELGGKIGDDVELLRWWSPFLLYGHKSTIKGWKKLADAVWEDPKVSLGYSKNVLDVEHASEYISDSTPELIFIDEDSTYYKRLFYTAEHFENLWSVKHDDGTRFFKSAWYSSTEVDEGKYKNRDVDYNARALKPLRYLAWYTQDQRFIDLLTQWSMGWVKAALSTDKNKPKGLLPPSINAYSKEINGEEPAWYKSGLYYDYFNWEFSVGSKILDNILFTYSLNKNDSLLLPIELTLELIESKLSANNNLLKESFSEGSEEWAAVKIINNNGFWNGVGKWRFFTNNNKYDELILKYGTDYTKFKLTGDESYVENNLEKSLDNLRYNTPLRTTMVVHTDRVRTPGTDNLKAMLVGDGTSEGSSPYYSITWADTDINFTAFVKKSENENITADLFSHSSNKTKIGAKLWQLNFGEYKITLSDKKGITLSEEVIKFSKPGEKIYLEIPARTLVKLVIKKNN
ncbi:MAG: hypothetical protein KJ571_00565 [Bacteroidetes bacterium]|nr:hypothetical protein [Bacteroidota bacterium]